MLHRFGIITITLLLWGIYRLLILRSSCEGAAARTHLVLRIGLRVLGALNTLVALVASDDRFGRILVGDTLQDAERLFRLGLLIGSGL